VTKGSLVSEVLNRALFELPVGQLSPILECDSGFYIIVVTDREEARRTPFLEAQVEIEPKIKQQRAKEQMRAYVLRLRERIPVWTIFDDADEAANARRPPQGPYPGR
jgi:parvulin-like peptidyl-prolyl isomerase